MNLQPILDWGHAFYQQYPIFCYVVAGVLLLLLLWKPAKLLKAALLCLVLAAILAVCFYLIDTMNIGFSAKEKAIHKTEDVLKN